MELVRSDRLSALVRTKHAVGLFFRLYDRKFTEMDSHDEKLEKILRANKEDDARAYARQKEQQLTRDREQQQLRGSIYGFSNSNGVCVCVFIILL